MWRNDVQSNFRIFIMEFSSRSWRDIDEMLELRDVLSFSPVLVAGLSFIVDFISN